MLEAYKKFWTNYANFKDRTTVKDYWFVILMQFIIGFVLGLISGIVPALSIIVVIYGLAIIVPSLSIVVRRLHDINKSGWHYFMMLIPIAGPIIILIYLCTSSKTENNNYGVQL